MKRAFLLLLAAVALVGAGCGGDDKNDYVTEFNKVGSTLKKTLTSLGTDLTGSTDPKQIASTLNGSAKALDSAAGDLQEIDPPDDAESAHEKIVSGVRDLAKIFRDGAKQASSGDLAKLATTFTTFEKSGGARKIMEAQKELKDKGYKVQE